MIYARSDVCSITISEAHGGCNQPHVRPPGELLWGLSCEACEQHLRTDTVQWSTIPDKVPETFDEVNRREAAEQNIGRRQLARMDRVDAMLSLLQAPRDILAGGAPLALAPAATLLCNSCDAPLAPGNRFCGRCGDAVIRQVEAAS